MYYEKGFAHLLLNEVLGKKKKKKKKFSGRDRKQNRFRYHVDSKYWDRQAGANSVDPDQTPHNAASDQGLHC